MNDDERNRRRREFIERRRHELAGLVMDGATGNRVGADFALWARSVMHRTDAMLGQMFDDLLPSPKPDLNKPIETKQPPRK